MTNRYDSSQITCPTTCDGLPFIYIGRYKDYHRDDPHARVILKDGTTRIGPWKNNGPVGDWWEDHAKRTTTPEELAKLLSFAETEHQEGVVVKLEASSNEDQEDSEATDTEKEAKNEKKRCHTGIQSIAE